MKTPLAAAVSALVCVAAEARADPLVLRAPVTHRVVAVTIGAPELSAGFWLTRKWGVAFEWRLPASSFGASAGTRWTLVGDTLGWGVDFALAVGVVVPLLAPAAGVSVTPALVGRWRDEIFHVATSLVMPAVVRVVPDPTVRLPVMIEVWFIVHLGPVYVGAQGSVGDTYVPGLSWAGAIQASGFLGWDL